MRESLTEKDEGIDYRINLVVLSLLLGFHHTSVSKESACNAGDPGLIPGSERSPGEENGDPLQYSCLEKPTDRGAWQAIVHRVARVRYNLATKPPSIQKY